MADFNNKKVEEKNENKPVENKVVENKPMESKPMENKPVVKPITPTNKRVGKLTSRIGRNVLIVDKEGKGYTLPNKNFRNKKIGDMVEF